MYDRSPEEVEAALEQTEGPLFPSYRRLQPDPGRKPASPREPLQPPRLPETSIDLFDTNPPYLPLPINLEGFPLPGEGNDLDPMSAQFKKETRAKPKPSKKNQPPSQSSTLQISDDLRALGESIRKLDAPPTQRRAIADGMIDLYVHATTAPGSEKLDESRTREDLKAILDLVAPSNVSKPEAPSDPKASPIENLERKLEHFQNVEAEIRRQFRASAQVQEIVNRIDRLAEQLERAERLAKAPQNDPVCIRYRKQLANARAEYNVLWQRLYPRLKVQLSQTPTTESRPALPPDSSLFQPGAKSNDLPRIIPPDVPRSARAEDDDAFSGHTDDVSQELTPAEEARLPSIESIRPLPITPIPNDPPPHEGAMIDLPMTIEPPDLIVVEALETLPGRPITGERLVRPDGTITLGFYGDVHVRGLTLEQAKAKVTLHLRKYLTEEVLGLVGIGPDGHRIVIQPEDSDRVFVDMASHNSKVYYVQGDVTAPGRLPCTGKETVLDALNYAGGLHHLADATNVRLIRPARGDQPRKVFKLDLKAIEEGDATANLQLFPNDRLVIGRDPIVQSTIIADRVVAPLKTIASGTLLVSATIRYLEQALDSVEATPQQRHQVVDGLVNFWMDALTRPENKPMNEEKVRQDLQKILELLVPTKPARNKR